MVDLTVAQRGMKLGDMVDLTFAQGGMKLRDGRFDCCTERNEYFGWYI